MIKFITKHKILYVNQFGFRKDYSTTLALIDTIEYRYIGIFLDIQKAFDTVHHDIMCQKLENYGFRGHSLTFLRSYLNNRTQYTVVNNCNSSTRGISYGVPQGSILGPLLFLLYINDIHNAISTAQARLFADDTSVLLKNRNLKTLIRQAEGTLEEINNWFLLNKMSLSLGKTNFILFHGVRKDPAVQLNKLSIGINSIEELNLVNISV